MALTLRRPPEPSDDRPTHHRLRDRARRPEAGGPTPGSDVVVGLVGGVAVGLVAFALPGSALGIVLVLVMAGLVALAAVLRTSDLRGMAYGCTLAFAFLCPLNKINLGGIEPSDILMALSIGLYVLMRFQGHRDIKYKAFGPIFFGLFLLGAGGLIGTFFEPSGPFFYWLDDLNIAGFGPNLANLARFTLGCFGPPILFALAQLDRKQITKVAIAFVSAHAVSIVVGVVLLPSIAGGRRQGLAAHPGQLGSISILSLGICAGLYLNRRRFSPIILGTMFVCIAGAYLSGSRAALGGIVAFCVFIGPATRRRLVLGAAVAGVAIVFLLAMSGFANNVEGENALSRALGKTDTASASNVYRTKSYTDTKDRWLERPLVGNGFNYIRPSNNVYLGIAASTGVTGLSGLAFILFTLFRRVWRRRSDMLVIGVATGYAGYLVDAWYDNLFFWRWLWCYISILVVVCATSRAEPDGAPSTADQSRAHA